MSRSACRRAAVVFATRSHAREVAQDAATGEVHLALAMTGTDAAIAEVSRLRGLLSRGRSRVLFSGHAIRLESRGRTLLKSTPLEALDDVSLRRGWFSSSMTVRTADGDARRIGGLDRGQASRVVDAVLACAADRAESLSRELSRIDRLLDELWERDRFVRCSALLEVHEQLKAAVGALGGLVARQLRESDQHVLRRLEDLVRFESIDALRAQTNQRFVSRSLGRVSSAAAGIGAALTDEQAQAVATDEDVTLVLAGAGTGKTTVIAAKVAHLVRNEGVRPGRILVLAFNQKAQREIAGRLSGDLSGASVQTFHAFGRRVVADVEGQPDVSEMATDSHVLESAIDGILSDLIDSDATAESVLGYLTYHFNAWRSPFEFANWDEYDAYCRAVELRTLAGGLVNSFEELRIANFLTEHGVRFDYEAKYEHPTATLNRRQYRPDFWLPDSRTYLEHFALDEHGNPPPYWDDYAEGVKRKRDIHRRHGTSLIETHSWQHRHGTWQSSLRDQLESAGVELAPIPRAELLERLSKTRVSVLAGRLATFLNQVKTSNIAPEALHARGRARGDTARNLAFLDIFGRVQQRYEQLLAQAGDRDFHDFINLAADYIRDGKWQSRYRYVLVDEFQDISAGRMNLLQRLDGAGVAYFAVGDDWQSINRFAGSDVSLMRDCGTHLGHAQQRILSRTFRYGPAILDPSAEFVQQNPEQTQRPLHTASSAPDGGITVVAQADPAAGIETALEDIRRRAPGVPPDTLVLGRYKATRDHVPRPQRFSTVHRAKGTEADYVIVLDLVDDRWGFPSQIDDDPILEMVLPPAGGTPFAHAEDRRLFYVALTRARRGVYLVTHPDKPSEFVLELTRRSEDLRHIGQINSAPRCARCADGRLVRSKSLKTLRCTNSPLCEHQAPRCHRCGDGYLVIDRHGSAACTGPACAVPPEMCPRCGLGLIVPRERTDGTGRFLGCTEYWSKINCTYTRSITAGRRC